MAPKAFVLMPFAPEFDEIYNLFITDALVEAGFDVFRADDLRDQQNILKDIVQSVVTADLIVADLTGANPNFYYELGLAHGLHRPVVLLTQDVSSLPFDLRSYRVISYNTHFAAVKTARSELIAIAKGARGGTVRFGSPVTDFAGEVGGPAGRGGPQLDVLADEGPPGFLDHLVQLEDGFTELAGVVGVITAQTQSIGASTETSTGEITKATTEAKAGYVKHVRKVARELGEQVEQYAAEVARANDRYADVLRSTSDSLEYIVTASEPQTPEAKEQLENLLKVLTEVESSAAGSRRSSPNLRTQWAQRLGSSATWTAPFSMPAMNCIASSITLTRRLLWLPELAELASVFSGSLTSTMPPIRVSRVNFEVQH